MNPSTAYNLDLYVVYSKNNYSVQISAICNNNELPHSSVVGASPISAGTIRVGTRYWNIVDSNQGQWKTSGY